MKPMFSTFFGQAHLLYLGALLRSYKLPYRRPTLISKTMRNSESKSIGFDEQKKMVREQGLERRFP